MHCFNLSTVVIIRYGKDESRESNESKLHAIYSCERPYGGKTVADEKVTLIVQQTQQVSTDWSSKL